jgi:hypothetical protein
MYTVSEYSTSDEERMTPAECSRLHVAEALDGVGRQSHHWLKEWWLW